jgi:hypothetical protein
MNALLYSKDIISPQIAGIQSFVQTQFDHAWLVGSFDLRYFTEMDMQELRSELQDIASYGVRGGQLDFVIEKLELLRKALQHLDIIELRRKLRERRKTPSERSLF